VSNSPLSAVAECFTLSRLINVTVLPLGTVRSAVEKAKFLISTTNSVFGLSSGFFEGSGEGFKSDGSGSLDGDGDGFGDVDGFTDGFGDSDGFTEGSAECSSDSCAVALGDGEGDSLAAMLADGELEGCVADSDAVADGCDAEALALPSFLELHADSAINTMANISAIVRVFLICLMT
jgi:hypothetical protein